MDPMFTIIWFVAGSSLILVLYLLLSKKKNPIEGRLEEITDQPLKSSPSLSVADTTKSLKTLAEQEANRRLERENKKNQLKQRIVQAGLYRQRAIALFAMARITLLIAPIAIAFAISASGEVDRKAALIMGGATGLMGTLAPSFWLDHLKKDRQKKIRRALPDALDVIVVCLEGGLSLTGALARVARELSPVHPMLALELSIVEREIQMGRTGGEAMRQFAQRFDLEELRSLASVVSQAESFGSSVVKALTVYAEAMRVRRRQFAEEMAQKASIKILFPTILCIFPGIFVVLLGPAAIQIYEVVIRGAMSGG